MLGMTTPDNIDDKIRKVKEKRNKLNPHGNYYTHKTQLCEARLNDLWQKRAHYEKKGKIGPWKPDK